MNRSGRQKGNRASNLDQLRERKDEYTAARTRPFSFEEIMKTRKNKELAQPITNNIGGVEMISMSDSIQDSSAPSVSLKGARETKRLSSVIERLPPGEHMKESNLEELRHKEEHASMKGGLHVKRNRNTESRESAAQLQSNLMSELWSRDNKAETEKQVHTRNEENEWHRGDPKYRRLGREIRTIGYRDETQQKIHSGGGKDQRTRNYREDRGQRNELRSTDYRKETQKKINSRSKNNELPRNNIENRATRNTVSETVKKIPRRGKDDEWPRNDSVDKARQSYHRDSVVKDRYADRSEGILEKGSKRRHQNTDDRVVRNKNAVTKHDLGRSRDSEVAEKKGKKELSGSGNEETRVNRKRSRSQDRGKMRDRRSLSLSPEAHKSMSSNGKKLGDSSSHSLKDRSGEQQKDVDRSKFSSNGTGNLYRGHGELTSGLGGYSPRKRKSENAIKTPSPKNRSPERKSAGWDIPPTGVKDSTSSVRHGPELSEHQAVSLNVHELVSAVTAALNASKPLPGSSGFFPEKNNVSVDSIQLTESTRPMRQLYIENTPASASEKDIMEYLNNRLLSSGANCVQGKQPCISCIIHKEKCQALVEFLTPEDASATFSFDGSSFSGSILKIRRPKDFVEVATSDSSEAAKSTTVPLSNTVKDSPHKIFIGGISEALSTEMLIEIASAFGQLKAFYFDPQQESLKRCAFLEYVDQSVTLKACAGLKGMKLGGQVLTVVQALSHALPMVLHFQESCEREPTCVIPDHAKPLLEKPTQVVKLKNVFTPEDMYSLSKSEIEEVLEDIRLECARFGTVRSLNVVEQETVPVNNTEENCGDHNDNKTAEGGENLQRGDKIFSETCGEVSETVSEELKKVGVQKILQEKQETDLEPEGSDHEENVNDVIKSEDDSAKQFDIKMDPDDPTPDLSSTEKSNKPSLWVDHIECSGSKESETSHIKDDVDYTKESAGTESNLEQGISGAGKARGDLCVAQNGVTEGRDSELGHVFELGSVLVEYKRTEGSCIAAHSLHGRLFDERIMMVEYVPLELYQAKFPR